MRYSHSAYSTSSSASSNKKLSWLEFWRTNLFREDYGWKILLASNKRIWLVFNSFWPTNLISYSCYQIPHYNNRTLRWLLKNNYGFFGILTLLITCINITMVTGVVPQQYVMQQKVQKIKNHKFPSDFQKAYCGVLKIHDD